MDILNDALLNYIRIISKKYKIPLKKLKPLIDKSWKFEIDGTVTKEEIYIDDQGEKYIKINNITGLKLIY